MSTLIGRKAAIADKLFSLGAVKFGAFTLKIHETKPDEPLSPIYLNLRTPENPKEGPLDEQVINLIAEEMLVQIFDNKLRGCLISGVPNAGLPFSAALTALTHGLLEEVMLYKQDLPEGKRRVVAFDPGSSDASEGVIPQHPETGAWVVGIDDLITHSKSKEEAIDALRSIGLVIRHFIVLVDRMQGGIAEILKTRGVTVHAIFTLKELLDYYVETGRIEDAKRTEVFQYLGITA